MHHNSIVNEEASLEQEGKKKFRYGWTTGACATAAAKAAYSALCHHVFPDPVEITLPQGKKVFFPLAKKIIVDQDCTKAFVIKDAGDDPDVTHGAKIGVQIRRLPKGSGIIFQAGKGVGIVTRPGLVLSPGEPAINPVPRQMIRQALMEIHNRPNVEVTIEIEQGEMLAEQTLNARLGIIGGLSILGTTGIVTPFSCAAWISTIHQGIDVARATGDEHLIASVGHSSEQAAQAIYQLPETALIEMGDFVGGLLKYLCYHPVKNLTLAGGVAKMTKLAQGHLDLHSSRSRVDFLALGNLAQQIGADQHLVEQIIHANTAAEAFILAQKAALPLGERIAEQALKVAKHRIESVPIHLEILLFDRQGKCCGRASEF